MSWTKYGNRKTVVDGITFDSRAEARRYQELRLLERAGQISDLRLQVCYPLIPVQRLSNGNAERAVVYVADFTYFDDRGQLVVEDVKGARPKEYIIKRKLMKYFHDIEIKEV